MKFSVIIPVYNESEALEPLHTRLAAALTGYEDFEIVFVDDGSTDGSAEVLRAIARRDPRTRTLSLRRNYGQTAALAAGFDHAKGEIVVTLDADLQNPPEEIPRLLARLDEGYDLVSGWRKNRHDAAHRRFLSGMANRLIGVVTGVSLHDYGCTLKAYRRDLLHDIRLYGEMHRFLPALAGWAGARIVEIEVAHSPRRTGRSHYGSERIFKVLVDLLTIKLIGGYGTKPGYVFGLGGFLTLFVSFALGIFAIYRRLALGGEWMSPLTIISIVLFPLGIQFFLLGFIAEIGSRTYYESQNKATYLLREN